MIDRSISIVLPAYNEAESIESAIENIFDFLKNNFIDFEIIVVDDGSRDDTYAICLSVKNRLNGNIKILQHNQNKGYGAALRTGLFSAEKELIFYTDSDNQFDISEILKFTKAINDCDLVIGYRIGRRDTVIRKFVSTVYKLIIRIIFGLKVRDVDCAFKLFKKECLNKLSIERDKFFVDTELLLKAQLKKCRIKEIGVKHLPREFGQSTVRFSNVFETLADIFYFWFKLRGNGYGNNKKV